MTFMNVNNSNDWKVYEELIHIFILKRFKTLNSKFWLCFLLKISAVCHLSLSSWDRASSTCRAVLGGREMESRVRFRLASRARIRGPKLSPPGRVGKRGESLSRAKLKFCLWASRVKKQEGHVSQAGKESQCPRLQESQRAPVMPGRHKQAPVCLSQPSGRVPSASHRHSVEEETRKSADKKYKIQPLTGRLSASVPTH